MNFTSFWCYQRIKYFFVNDFSKETLAIIHPRLILYQMSQGSYLEMSIKMITGYFKLVIIWYKFKITWNDFVVSFTIKIHRSLKINNNKMNQKKYWKYRNNSRKILSILDKIQLRSLQDYKDANLWRPLSLCKLTTYKI